MHIKDQLSRLVENRKLLLVVALSFAVVFSIQCFELPYGNSFFSLFYVGKDQVTSVGNFSDGSSSSSFTLSDKVLTSSNGINSTDTTGISDGIEAIGQHFVDSLDVGSDSGPEDESPSEDVIGVNSTFAVTDVRGLNVPFPEKVLEDPQNKSASNNGTAQTSVSTSTSSITIQSSDSLPPFRAPGGMETNSRAPVVSVDPTASSVYKDAGHTLQKAGSPGYLKTDLELNHSSINSSHKVNKKSKSSESSVVSFAEMNDMLISSLTTYRAEKPKWTSKSDQELLHAKSLIESSTSVQDEPSLHAPLYRNFSMFKRSYDLMEQTLKVYIYKEGESPIFHTTLLKGVYASEGWFMKHLKASKKFTTTNPKKAHLFYLPYSSRLLKLTMYVPNSHNRTGMHQRLKDYISLIKSTYSFWNRTEGADHFLVACHDWAPAETKRTMANCIRALCNADIKQGLQFGKDLSLPTTYIRLAQNPLKAVGGEPPSKRRILAFFAGNMHGYLRPILLKHWENKDPDMKIFGRMPVFKGQMSYIEHMKRSKYCICAKGYQGYSPRVVEAIFYECVPVILSDNYVPPFFETLDWESFAVFVPEKDIPDLKNILLAIPRKRYLLLQRRVKLVQQHFLWHPSPVKYDIFHMILHSIWYTRVLQLGPS